MTPVMFTCQRCRALSGSPVCFVDVLIVDQALIISAPCEQCGGLIVVEFLEASAAHLWLAERLCLRGANKTMLQLDETVA